MAPKVENPDATPALQAATPFVDDKYEYDVDNDMIGQGTYGHVFRARVKGTDGRRLEDQVALKRIRMESEKEGFPITALREIKLLKQLNHENIVRMREIVRSKVNAASKYKGDIYMVFDYAKYDLSAILKKVETKEMVLSEQQVKCIMRQLLRGLAFCHVNGVLHRDLKSANLLINERGELKIADFGLARPYQSNADDGRLTSRVCTLWYRPPELFLGSEHYGPEVDVWSVGCIFAELLSRKPLFPGKDEPEMVERIFSMFGVPTEKDWPEVSKLPFYDKINPSYPRARSLQRWCEEHKVPAGAVPLLKQMLSVNPKQRIAAADAYTHKYFQAEPRECPVSALIPRHIGDTHEFTAKHKKRPHEDRHHMQGPPQQQRQPNPHQPPPGHHHHHPQGYGAPHPAQQAVPQYGHGGYAGRGGQPARGGAGYGGGGGGYGAPPAAAAAGMQQQQPQRGGMPGGGRGYQGGGGYQGARPVQQGYQGMAPQQGWPQQGAYPPGAGGPPGMGPAGQQQGGWGGPPAARAPGQGGPPRQR